MDVIVWRGTYQSSGIQLRDGIQVVLAGTFDVYTGSGRLSFIAKSIEPVGEGLLRQQVEALARKLNAEGLMDDAAKRRIPRFCQRVAVVTSLSGAVIDDVKRTLRRRNPLVELMCVGCAVQGQGAPETIIRALKVAEAARPEAILLVRGGGSFEDLMTFNDEALARAIAASGVPIVTGIGHEPDTTIADMVADRRCSTPTAAAESIAPAIDEIVQAIEGRRQRMGSALAKMLYEDASSLTNNANRMGHAMRTRVAHEQDLLNALSHTFDTALVES
jgi:exodeoxyribonuclease VII large subunit